MVNGDNATYMLFEILEVQIIHGNYINYGANPSDPTVDKMGGYLDPFVIRCRDTTFEKRFNTNNFTNMDFN